MTPPSRIPVDPTVLETHSIIRATPSWKEVEVCRQRLAALRQQSPPQPYDLMEADRDNVLRYASTLERSSDTIALGVGLATHLSRFSSSTTPAQRLEDGFRALSTGLDLRALDETNTRSELERCFRAAFPNLTLAPVPLRSPADSQAPDPWRAALEEMLRSIRTQSLPYMSEIPTKAWENWQARLQSFAINGIEVPADIHYLRSRAAVGAPGTVLAGRLKSKTLREWSDAYIAGVKDSSSGSSPTIPLWFGLGALFAAGFDAQVGPLLSASKHPEVEAAQQFAARIPSTSPRKGLIIVRLPADSQTANWRVSATVPALAVTYEDYIGLAKVDMKVYFQSRLHGVLIEVDRAEQPDAALRRVDMKLINAGLPSVRVGFLMTQPALTPGTVSGYPVAMAPNDAAGALSQTFQPT